MELDFNELRELLTALDQTDITELTLKSADFELTVRKGTPISLREVSEQESRVLPAVPLVSAATPIVTSTSRESLPSGVADSTATTPTPAATPPQAEPKGVIIKSPMVGTFYRSPAPDELPYVEVGDRIRQGQTVCIIEAMKLMNEIEAEVSGQVMEVLVQSGESVEYEQPLMRINPD